MKHFLHSHLLTSTCQVTAFVMLSAVSLAARADAQVSSLVKISETRVDRTVFEYVFKLSVQNDGIARPGVIAILQGAGPGTTVIAGSVLVGDLAPNQQRTTDQTITIRHDRNIAFNPNLLNWRVATPVCADLADAAKANAEVLSATAALIPAAGNTPSYCRVDLMQKQAIGVRIGLPRSAADGGTGGIQGAWNGIVSNQGGGGTGGTLGNPAAQVTAGYVGSSTDTGHSNAWCNAINPDTGKPNSLPNCGGAGFGFVLDSEGNPAYPWQKTDWLTDAPLAQVRWALDLGHLYYGREPDRNYWTGCSSGGGQAMALAQEAGHLFDGIIAGAPAQHIGRLLFGVVYPAVVAKDVIGLPAGLPPAKSTAANAAAVAACDANDGIVDGLVQEPRRCTFSAQALRCTGEPGEPATCLSQAEATAMDLIWEGPRNAAGQRLWGGFPKGGSINSWLPGGNAPGPTYENFQKYWVHADPAWDWRSITLAPGPTSYETEFEMAFALHKGPKMRETSDLGALKARGGKLIMWNGLHDQLSGNPFGVYNYFGRLVDRYGMAETHSFTRSFLFPGVAHCGGGNAPQPPDLFNVMRNWVENGVDPQHVVASQNLGGGVVRTRKVCKYPDEAVYSGSGSTDNEANFTCKVNASVPADLAEAARSNHDELR